MHYCLLTCSLVHWSEQHPLHGVAIYGTCKKKRHGHIVCYNIENNNLNYEWTLKPNIKNRRLRVYLEILEISWWYQHYWCPCLCYTGLQIQEWLFQRCHIQYVGYCCFNFVDSDKISLVIRTLHVMELILLQLKYYVLLYKCVRYLLEIEIIHCSRHYKYRLRMVY